MSVLLESKQILNYIQASDAISWYTVLYHASKIGDLDTLKLLSIHNQHIYTQRSCFGYACKYGHRHIVHFFLDHLKEFQSDQQSYMYLLRLYCLDGLLGASTGGHLDIVQIILDNYQPYQPNQDEVTRAFENACYTCSWDIIFYLKEKFKINQSCALKQACKGRHTKLVDWLIKNGDHNWNGGLLGACESGDVSLVQLMIKHGATNIRHGFQVACQTGHVEASKYLLDAGYIIICECVLHPVSNVEIIKLLLEYDSKHDVSISSINICALLNAGVSPQKLSEYEAPGVITRIVSLAEKILNVVQFSLRDIFCFDLVNDLKSFIGYNVNEQIEQAIRHSS